MMRDGFAVLDIQLHKSRVNVTRRIDEVRNIFGSGYINGVRVDRRFCNVSCRRNVDPPASTFRVHFSADPFTAGIEASVKQI
jgi:hypothetical protein